MIHLELFCTALACMLMNELVGDACMASGSQRHRVYNNQAIFCSDTIYVHTDPDGLPSFAE